MKFAAVVPIMSEKQGQVGSVIVMTCMSRLYHLMMMMVSSADRKMYLFWPHFILF